LPSINGSFAGKITKRSALPLTDQPNHELSLAEVTGTQQSPDPLWNNATITYWGVTDVVNGKGTQRGYYNNVRADKTRDFGTFEGKVTASGNSMTVEGTWKIEGGEGQLKGATGSGTFKTTLKSETEVEATWEGAYQIAKAQAG